MLLFTNAMANQGLSNNRTRPARDARASGGKTLTGARCSLSEVPPKRFTGHKAMSQILADDSEDIYASDYGNDSAFESEVSADSLDSDRCRSLTWPRVRANLAEAKFMAVVMALAGLLKMGVVPRPM